MNLFAHGLIHHSISLPIIAALAAAMTLSVKPAGAQSSETAARVQPDASSAANNQLGETSENGLRLFIGDLLQITFFEKYGKEVGQGGNEQAVLTNLVERPELTGEYIIQEDGTLFLPLLGTLKAEGETNEQLLRAIENQFSRLFGGQIKVSLKLRERQPVYVTGHVPQGGTFKHMPGMTVLHALALAGSTRPNAAEDWRKFDVSRERERMHKAEDRLRSLLARSDVLKAEQEGRSATASPPLVALAGDRRAGEMVAKANTIRDLELRQVQEDEEASSVVMSAIESELAVLRDSLQQSESRVKELVERLEAVSDLLKRKLTTDIELYSTQSQLSQARERWNEIRAAIARGERSLAEARTEQNRSALKSHVEASKESHALNQAIAEEEVTLTAIAPLIRGFGVRRPATRGRDAGFSVRILRRTSKGLNELKASDRTAVMPGDLLLVAGGEDS